MLLLRLFIAVDFSKLLLKMFNYKKYFHSSSSHRALLMFRTCFCLFYAERFSRLYCTIRRGNRVQRWCPARGKKTSGCDVFFLNLAIRSAHLHSCLLWEFFRSRATLELSHACYFCLLVATPSPFSPLPIVTPLRHSLPAVDFSLWYYWQSATDKLQFKPDQVIKTGLNYYC